MALSTSQAVKAVVNEFQNKLPDYRWLFDGFYDINRDFDEQFHQYYVQQKDEEERLDPWAGLMYSYDPADQSDKHHRLFSVKKEVNPNAFRLFSSGYFTTSLLLSVLSNDADIIDRMSEDLHMFIDRDFNTSYPDLMWFPWKPNEAVTLGAIRIPETYNSHVYVCTKAGTTGAREPYFEEGDTTLEDDEVIWTVANPAQMNVRAYEFKKLGFQQLDYNQNGIMFKLDIGCTLFFAALRDTYRVLPPVKYMKLDVASYTKDTADYKGIDEVANEIKENA